LQRVNEILGARLNTLHNLHYYLDLMAGIRRAIESAAPYPISPAISTGSRRHARIADCLSDVRLHCSGWRYKHYSRAAPIGPRRTTEEIRNMFISNAYAQASPAASDPIMTFLPMVAIFVAFYFFLIRPQQKRAKETRAMLGALQVGDEIVISGGIAGKVKKLSDNYLDLEVADNVEIKVQRAAVQLLLPKGTLKSL
jgi:preprotein translocase subunit YajC